MFEYVMMQKRYIRVYVKVKPTSEGLPKVYIHLVDIKKHSFAHALIIGGMFTSSL